MQLAAGNGGQFSCVGRGQAARAFRSSGETTPAPILGKRALGKTAIGILVLCLVVGTGVGTRVVAASDDDARVRETLESCFGCHGENGISAQPEFPILAGQHFYYLYVQLKDFKAGRRQSPEMAPIVAQLSKEDMRTIAQFFSEQEWPNIGYRAEPGLAK